MARNRRNRLGVLPCISAVRRYRERIHANALVDLSARNIAILQVLEVDKNLVWPREIGAGRAGEEAGRAGEADAKGTELSASARRGVGKTGGDGASGDGGGVRLSVPERTVGSDKHLLTTGNDNVWTELASRGGKEVWGEGRKIRMKKGAHPLRQYRGVLDLPKRQ